MIRQASVPALFLLSGLVVFKLNSAFVVLGEPVDLASYTVAKATTETIENNQLSLSDRSTSKHVLSLRYQAPEETHQSTQAFAKTEDPPIVPPNYSNQDTIRGNQTPCEGDDPIVPPNLSTYWAG